MHRDEIMGIAVSVNPVINGMKCSVKTHLSVMPSTDLVNNKLYPVDPKT